MQEPAAPENTPAHTLDQIRAGGTQLLSVARERLADVEGALDRGHFQQAYERAEELLGRIGPLAQAQHYLGAMGESFVVRAANVTEGMTLKQWGKVLSVEREDVPVPGSDPCVHMTIRCDTDEDPKMLHGEQELIALRSDTEPAPPEPFQQHDANLPEF